MVAFVSSVLLSLALAGGIVWYSKRRPLDRSPSWGEAMLAATLVFFLMFWVYGIVPHQFLTWADNELKWRPDAYLVGPSSTAVWHIFGATIDLRNVPFNLSKQAIRDLLVVGIYGGYLVGHVMLFSIWQKRGATAQAKQKAIEEHTTAYGRPLVRKA